MTTRAFIFQIWYYVTNFFRICKEKDKSFVKAIAIVYWSRGQFQMTQSLFIVITAGELDK